MKSKKLLTTGMTLVLSASLLAGCSSSSSASDSSKGSGSKPQTVNVVLEADNQPYTYEDDNGKPAGYEYEVLKAVDKKLDNYNFKYQVLDYETAQAGLESGKYDLLSGCKFRTPAREEAFLVSKPYNYFFMNLVVKKDADISSLEDMNGKSIAPIVGTDGRAVALQDWIKKHPDVKIKFKTLASSGTMADEISQVEDGVYDAAYLSKEQADAILKETGYTDLKITDRVDGRDTVFLINKKEKDLQTAVNKALDELTSDGTLGKMTKDAFGEDNFEVAKKLGLTSDKDSGDSES